jgi:hypothetical protein
MDNSKYALRLVVPETDDTWREGMIIGTTEWHYPGTGEAIQSVPTSDGQKEERKVVAQCRIVESLVLDEKATEEDTNYMKHLYPQVVAEVMIPSKTPAGGITSRTIFHGDPENPRGLEEKNLIKNLKCAWDEFIKHRGYIALSGQWLESPYTKWRLGMQAAEKAAKENANVVQQKPKPIGSNK